MGEYRCSNCGYISNKEESPCPQCVSYGTMYRLGSEPKKKKISRGFEAWSLVSVS